MSVALIVVLFFARASWRMSGSNQWELFRDDKGVKVYTLKQPGNDLVRVRGVTRVKSSLAGVVKWIVAGDETCKDIGCYETKTLETVNDQIKYSYFRFNIPKPFKPREFVVREHVHQIPQTKEVWAELAAVPERYPPNDCCFRVTNMSNTWRVTPVGNGVVEVEYAVTMNEGGWVPFLLLNRQRPRWIYYELSQLQKYLDRPEYQNAKYDFIKEPEGIQTAGLVN